MNGVDDFVTANVDVFEVLNAFIASVLTDKVSQFSVISERVEGRDWPAVDEDQFGKLNP